MSSGALASGLLTTAGGIRGYWDGRSGLSVNQTISDDWDRFQSLDGSSRANLIGNETVNMVHVERTDTHILVNAGDQTLLTLKRMLNSEADALFRDQLPLMPSYAALRGDRLTEITYQTSDILSFYNAQLRLDPNRAPNSVLLLNSFASFVSAVVAQVKFYVTAKRPIDYAREVMPIIPTPSHSSLPSGHATASFAIAQLITRLEPRTPGNLQNEHLFRLAARISDNRVIAGVHFPVDNRIGAVLGITLADYFASALQGGNALHPREADPVQESAQDFTLDTLVADLAAKSGGIKRQGSAIKIPAHDGPLLPTLWKKALAEWH